MGKALCALDVCFKRLLSPLYCGTVCGGGDPWSALYDRYADLQISICGDDRNTDWVYCIDPCCRRIYRCRCGSSHDPYEISDPGTIGLPAIWVLAAVTIGGSLMGILGMLVGVPLAAALYRLISEDVNRADLLAEHSQESLEQVEK